MMLKRRHETTIHSLALEVRNAAYYFNTGIECRYLVRADIPNHGSKYLFGEYTYFRQGKQTNVKNTNDQRNEKKKLDMLLSW